MDSFYNDNTAVRPPYLLIGNSYSGKNKNSLDTAI